MKKILTSLMAVCVIASSSFAFTSLQWGYSYGLFENDLFMVSDPLYILKAEKNITDLGWRGFNANMSTVNWDGTIAIVKGLPVRLALVVNDQESITPMSNYSLVSVDRLNGTNWGVGSNTYSVTTDASKRDIKLVCGIGDMLGISYQLFQNLNNLSGTIDNAGAQQRNIVSNVFSTNNGALVTNLNTIYNPGNRACANTNTHTLTPSLMIGEMQIYIPITYMNTEVGTYGSLTTSNYYPTNAVATPQVTVNNWVNGASYNYVGIGGALRTPLMKSGDMSVKLYASLSAAYGFLGNSMVNMNANSVQNNLAGGLSSNYSSSNVTYWGNFFALPIITSNCVYLNTRIADNKIKLGIGAGVEATIVPQSYNSMITNATRAVTNGYVLETMTTGAITSNNVFAINGSIFLPAAVQIDCTEWLAIRAGVQPRFAYTSTTTTTTPTPAGITATTISNGVVTSATTNAAQSTTTTVNGVSGWSTGVQYSFGLTFTVSKDFVIDMQYGVNTPMATTDIWALQNWAVQASFRF